MKTIRNMQFGGRVCQAWPCVSIQGVDTIYDGLVREQLEIAAAKLIATAETDPHRQNVRADLCGPVAKNNNHPGYCDFLRSHNVRRSAHSVLPERV
jgi:hypothetical protein